MLLAALLVTLVHAGTEVVHDTAGLERALARAQPGALILLAPGEYRGGARAADVHGTPDKPIVVAAQDPAAPPRFVGGVSGLQLSRVTHVELRDLAFEGATGNGVNIDDGGDPERPSRHVTLRRLTVTDLPPGNHDGIKLSGVQDFQVVECTVERWGGSAVDMVGCHRGLIVGCRFEGGGDNGVQAKGGSSDVTVRLCRFFQAGQRGVNLGGSTGVEFFRPPLAAMGGSKYEAKRLTVEGCTFVGGTAPVAFVGVDGARVRFNTIVDPGRWALRILQETTLPGFVPSRGGEFTDNLVVFRSDRWASGGVNVGPGTEPESFRFARNLWFCSDRPSASRPALPTAETDGVYGVDPKLERQSDGTYLPATPGPAAHVGAHALK